MQGASKIAQWIGTSMLVCVVSIGILCNAVILAISVTTAGQEIHIAGVIPYVFGSSTMQPAIAKNDLVFFRALTPQQEIVQGDIVLYQADSRATVSRVLAVEQDRVLVDIDTYPPLAQVGAMRQYVDRQAVYARYIGRNRWLGALILFANTIMGRILLLILPILVLFYNRTMQKQRYRKDKT